MSMKGKISLTNCYGCNWNDILYRKEEEKSGLSGEGSLICPLSKIIFLPRVRSASDHICLNPRRPNINTPADQREPGLPPYLPELQMPPEAILNYNQTVLSVKGITTGEQYMSRTIALSFIEFSIQRAMHARGGGRKRPPRPWVQVDRCVFLSR